MSFKVYINEGEWNQICAWVLKYPDVETGGDLFGLWLDEQTAVVQFVLGPGANCRRTTTSFFQDLDYLCEAGTYLTKQHGLCNVGQWHSHHKINLFQPSVGDENTVWSNMPNLGLDRYIVFIANISNEVTINCFLFQIKRGKQLPVKHGKFKLLSGNSPMRLNEKILQNVHNGAESFNEITEFEEEMNHDFSNKNNYENSSYTENRIQPVVCVTQQQRTTSKKTTISYATFENASQPIGHENSFNPDHVPTATPSHVNKEQLRDTAKQNTTFSAQENIEVVTVISCEIPHDKTIVTLETKEDQLKSNMTDAVSFNSNNWKQKQMKDDDTQSSAAHSNANLGRGSMTLTNYETDEGLHSDVLKSAELKLRAEQTGHHTLTCNIFKGKKSYVAKPVTPTNEVNKQAISSQASKASLGQQKNVENVNTETRKETSVRQKGVQTTVTYEGGYQTAITDQSGTNRFSCYDNVKMSTEPTPMDMDETRTTYTEHDINRADTPSGTITANIASNEQVPDSDDDDEKSYLCGLFKNMNICGSNKRSQVKSRAMSSKQYFA